MAGTNVRPTLQALFSATVSISKLVAANASGCYAMAENAIPLADRLTL